MTARTCYLQVLGTGGNELAPTLLVFTDTQRYLFNCSEGTLRFSREHRVRISRVRNVFVTRCSWENVGGIPGLAMTLREIGINKVMVHGPAAIKEFSRAAGTFLGQEKVAIEALCCERGQLTVFDDHCLSVTKVELMPESSPELPVSLDVEESSIVDSSRPLKRQKVTSPVGLCKSSTVVAFICQLATIPGKFDSEKAKEMGIPGGEIRRNLMLGKSVVTPDGRTVHSHEIVGPPQEGPTFLILECPNASFIPSILSSHHLQSGTISPNVIVHMSPADVVCDSSFEKWMHSFGPGTTHLLLHRDFCPAEVGIRGYLKLQLPLYCLNSDLFHLPSAKAPSPQPFLSNHVLVGSSLMLYHLRPVSKMGALEHSDTLKPITNEIEEKLTEMVSNKELAGKLNLIQANVGIITSRDEDEIMGSSATVVRFCFPTPALPSEPAVTFLGTSSAIPSKYRNSSGIILHSGTGHYMLLDCGEGNLEQIYHCFGQELGDHVIRHLVCIFISHIHADHHMGVIRVLLRRSLLLGQDDQGPLFIAPGLMIRWLTQYCQGCEEVACNFVDSKEFLVNDAQPTIGELFQMGLESVLTVPVIHCSQSYGIVLQHRDGWKLVYSGDTRPCHQLAMAGKGATLLIHEATFEPDLAAEAVARQHSTTEEALEISQEMGAQFTILTHFSVRYPHGPTTIPNGGTVGVAFDCMTIPLSQLELLPPLVPAIQDVFTLIFNTQDSEEQESLG